MFRYILGFNPSLQTRDMSKPTHSQPLAMMGRSGSSPSSPRRKIESHLSAVPPIAPFLASSRAQPAGLSNAPQGEWLPQQTPDASTHSAHAPKPQATWSMLPPAGPLATAWSPRRTSSRSLGAWTARNMRRTRHGQASVSHWPGWRKWARGKVTAAAPGAPQAPL